MTVTEVQHVHNVSTATTNSATTGTLTTPAVAGNLLIAHVGVDKSAGTFTVPAGWTELANVVGASASTLIVGKIAAGGEASLTISWTTSVIGGYATTFVEYTGVNPIDPFGPLTVPAYDDTARTSMSLDPGTTERAGLALAFFSNDTTGTNTEFLPTATGWALEAFARGGPGVVLLSRAVDLREDIPATTFTWTRSDQTIGAVVLINERPTKADTLVEGFDAFNDTIWDYWHRWKGDAFVLSGGKLTITPSVDYDEGANTKVGYDLTNSSLVVDLAAPAKATGGTGGLDSFIILYDAINNSNRIEFWLGGNVGETWLECQYEIDGIRNAVSAGAYNYANHRYLRLRHDGSAVHWEASGDGLTWASLRSWVPTFQMTDLRLDMFAGYWDGTPTGITDMLVESVNPTLVSPNKLRLGNGTVSSLRVGANAVTKAYLGTTQVWPASNGVTIFGSSSPGTMTKATDGPVRVGAAFYVMNPPAPQQVVGGRLWVPAEMVVPTSCTITLHGPSQNQDILNEAAYTPGHIRTATLNNIVAGQWNEVLFATPAPILSSAEGGLYYWIAYRFADGTYLHTPGNPTHFGNSYVHMADNGEVVDAPTGNRGRSAYFYDGGNLGLTDLMWGVDVIVANA